LNDTFRDSGALKNPLVFHTTKAHHTQMKKAGITLKQFHSIRCPVCHAGAGKRCITLSGRQRNEPHLTRKQAARGAIKKN
jgi:hypothetical protein